MSVFVLDSISFYEVTYVMDPTAYLAADVGFGTWVWRSGEFSPHSLSSRSRRVDRQFASRPQSRLAGKAKIIAGDCR